MRGLISIAVGFLVAWLVLLAVLAWTRPHGLTFGEAVRLLPDTVRLMKRLALDRTLPLRVRGLVWLLLGYLAMPFDLVPDFIPVLGWADDIILVCIVLRALVRRAGPRALRRHWPGSAQGLSLLWSIARLEGSPSDSGPEPAAERLGSSDS